MYSKGSTANVTPLTFKIGKHNLFRPFNKFNRDGGLGLLNTTLEHKKNNIEEVQKSAFLRADNRGNLELYSNFFFFFFLVMCRILGYTVLVLPLRHRPVFQKLIKSHETVRSCVQFVVFTATSRLPITHATLCVCVCVCVCVRVCNRVLTVNRLLSFVNEKGEKSTPTCM